MEIPGGGQPSLRDSLLFAWAAPALRRACLAAGELRAGLITIAAPRLNGWGRTVARDGARARNVNQK